MRTDSHDVHPLRLNFRNGHLACSRSSHNISGWDIYETYSLV